MTVQMLGEDTLFVRFVLFMVSGNKLARTDGHPLH